MLRDQSHFLNYKDLKIRKFYNKNELNRSLLKMLICDLRNRFNVRFFLKNGLFNRKNRYNHRYHNRCRITGKPRFVFNYFNLNRSTLKNYASFGLVSGLRKY